MKQASPRSLVIVPHNVTYTSTMFTLNSWTGLFLLWIWNCPLSTWGCSEVVKWRIPQYRTCSGCRNVHTGLALYCWQTLRFLTFNTFRVRTEKTKAWYLQCHVRKSMYIGLLKIYQTKLSLNLKPWVESKQMVTLPSSSLKLWCFLAVCCSQYVKYYSVRWIHDQNLNKQENLGVVQTKPDKNIYIQYPISTCHVLCANLTAHKKNNSTH